MGYPPIQPKLWKPCEKGAGFPSQTRWLPEDISMMNTKYGLTSPWNHRCFTSKPGLPFGKTKIAIENDHLQLIYPSKMVIFHSYFSLLEGTNWLYSGLPARTHSHSARLSLWAELRSHSALCFGDRWLNKNQKMKLGIPSGKRLHNYGKSPFLMGISVYQL